ncbi:hypothetical protein F0521_24390 [Ferrimonas sp. YFM]|nr:hypothetical protein F0521_24390 [Ferrimonas sp. YFM]
MFWRFIDRWLDKDTDSLRFRLRASDGRYARFQVKLHTLNDYFRTRDSEEQGLTNFETHKTELINTAVGLASNSDFDDNELFIIEHRHLFDSRCSMPKV